MSSFASNLKLIKGRQNLHDMENCESEYRKRNRNNMHNDENHQSPNVRINTSSNSPNRPISPLQNSERFSRPSSPVGHSDVDSYDEEENDEDETNQTKSFLAVPKYNHSINRGNTEPLNSTKLDKNYTKNKVSARALLSKDNLIFILIPIFAGFGMAVFLAYININMFTNDTQSKQSSSHKITCSDFLLLKQKFPDQDKSLWISLKSGIESVLNRKPTKPAIFMFLYDEDNSPTQLIEDIINITHVYLGNRAKPSRLKPKDINSDMIEDYGRLITAWRPRFIESGMLIVEHFDKIPAATVQAFHTICDSETPLVARSVVFLLMPIKVSTEKGGPTKIAEQTLNKLWNISLPSYVLDPLITRVTDTTLILKS